MAEQVDVREQAQGRPEPLGRVRNRRRKETRPDEILDAALEEFVQKGFAAARLDDVARRAGVAKGTIYLYFPSKGELFKAVVRRAVLPLLESVRVMTQTFAGSTEEFLRGPFKEMQLRLLQLEERHVARILITEGRAFPDLTDFYVREVIQRGLDTLRMVVARGVARGEFRKTNLEQFPQPLIAATVLALIWETVLSRHAPLDVEGLLDTHIDLLIEGLRARPA